VDRIEQPSPGIGADPAHYRRQNRRRNHRLIGPGKCAGNKGGSSTRRHAFALHTRR
jgi:hypothetical protein